MKMNGWNLMKQIDWRTTEKPIEAATVDSSDYYDYDRYLTEAEWSMLVVPPGCADDAPWILHHVNAGISWNGTYIAKFTEMPGRSTVRDVLSAVHQMTETGIKTRPSNDENLFEGLMISHTVVNARVHVEVVISIFIEAYELALQKWLNGGAV